MSENTWPENRRRAMYPDEHEQWNAMNYPGTRQLCVLCSDETGRCEEDEMTVEHIDGPLCIDCYRLQRHDDDDGDAIEQPTTCHGCGTIINSPRIMWQYCDACAQEPPQ